MRAARIVFVAVLVIASTLCFAQTLERGAVHGTVYDSSHAVIATAKITLSNPSTGFHRELNTTPDGGYDFEAVPPGEYTLVAEAQGFAITTVTGITVNVGTSVPLDVSMPLKSAQEQVTVSANIEAVDTSTAGVSQLMDAKSLETLPFPGRDYRDLAQLTPSAQVVPGLRGGIRLGGQQSDYSGLVIDGADTTNNYFGENFGSLETKNLTVPIEAVQEFQVVTNGFAPEFGRATGGLLNVVTKSGTNNVHGEAHEYYRGDSLSKNDALGNPSAIKWQNQFGGSIGFPIRKDRQFLFLSTDIQRNTGPLTTNLCHGDPACENDAGPIIPVAIPGQSEVLPPACANVTPGVTNLLPGCYGVANLGALEGGHTQFQDFFTLLGHYDYQITQANHFSIRGLFTRNHTRGFTGGHGQSETFDSILDTEDFVNQGPSGVFALTTARGRKVNEIRALVQYEGRKRHPIFSGAPEISIAGTGEFGQRFYLPANNDNGKLQIQDNFSYSFSKHDMKFGGDTDSFVDRKDVFAGWSAGRYNFASLADFDNLNPDAYFQGFGLNGIDPFTANTLKPNYQNGLGLYWQDKWQAKPNLTVTYGLRWDGTWNPQPQTPIPGQEVYTGVGPLGHGTKISPVPQKTPNDFKQWGPRVGIAWSLGAAQHPTVVRAAWGLYYAQTPTIFFPQVSNGGGSKSTTLFCTPSFGCAPGGGFGAPFQVPYTYPSTLSQTSAQLCGLSAPQPAIGCPAIEYADPALRNPRVSNVTVGVEHQFNNEWSVSVNYVYMYSSHLKTGGFSTSNWIRNLVPAGTDQFGRSVLEAVPASGACPADAQVFPGEPLPLDCSLTNFLGALSLASFSHGNYDEVVAGVNKRFGHRFEWFANYTWSRNFSNDSSERDTDTFFGTQDPFNINIDYGRNGLDITHQFKSGVSVQLPWSLNWSSNFIAHSGLPYPAYTATANQFSTDDADLNGDAVINQFSNNDRPTIQIGNGPLQLLSRYPARQPDFFTWDMRLSKDFKFGDRYDLRLIADIFNLTNRGNLYSNPDNSGFVGLSNCAPTAPLNGTPVVGFTCDPLTAVPKQGNVYTVPTLVNGPFKGVPLQFNYGVHDEISPGSTAFAAQLGVRFSF
ncbi:MAG TPA: carboxypeptidase regulatory-like domain-containing protein [Candidatus Acidoferrales bacterium]|nr:carboxypeptidase regulatory-like domain-containing protein [Candidatus Acidoferrales bacterium]